MRIETYIEEYYAYNAKKLHNIVDKILKNFGWISDKEHFYSLANEVFAHDILPNYDNESDFHAFVYSCLKKKILTEITRINRDRRMPYVRDNKGKKVTDSEGKYIKIPILSLNVPIEDYNNENFSLTDIIQSDCNIEQIVMGEDLDRIEIYLSKLSKIQQKIVTLLLEDYNAVEIQNLLHISPKEYRNHMAYIKAYENISILFRR